MRKLTALFTASVEKLGTGIHNSGWRCARATMRCG